jgi:hypothetical protein
MTGGLANKMFQYSLYRSLLHAGKDASLDQDSFVPQWDFEDVRLEQVFPGVQMRVADKLLISRLAGGQDIFSKARRRLPFFSKTSYIRERDFGYNPHCFALEGDYYLEGCWQTEKYFLHIREHIMHDFTFSGVPDKRNLLLLDKLEQEESVSIHVRKGADYNKTLTNGTCEASYYKEAIDYINERIKAPRYYVFTDNKQWARENIVGIEYTLVDWNPTVGRNNHLDMQLMSQCKHNIVANSTYSWWGAWLNRNQEKIVIGPQKWFSTSRYNTSNILPDKWVKL